MKITSIYPIYLSDASLLDENIELLKKVGFEEKHHFTNELNHEVHVLSTDSGTRVDLFSNSDLDAPAGLYGLRVSVDDLDEVLTFLEQIGYRRKSEIIETETNRSVFLENAAGTFRCYIIQHLK